MARVVLPLEVARACTAGVTEHNVEARDLRELVKALEQKFPGIRARLETGLAVAIDGEIFQDWFLQSVAAGSEVYFIPAIEGG